MALEGKGFFIWKIPKCEGGNSDAIAQCAQEAGLSHVLIKVANSTYAYNYDWTKRVDLCPSVVQKLQARGIQAWGWHYVYGGNPVGEAQIAEKRVKDLGLNGYVIDAESHYKKQPNNKAAANRFMQELRSRLGNNFPIALSSYRFPSYHPELPWNEFLEKVDINMPQVYWINSSNPGSQLAQTLREFDSPKFTTHPPIIPTGAAFTEHNWTPDVSEVKEFLDTTRSFNLKAANFWEWHSARDEIPRTIWETIRSFNWESGSLLPQDISAEYINALNSRDPENVVKLYTPSAVHVSAARTISGTSAIRSWYTQLLNSILPNATFSLTGFSGTGSSRHFTWTAKSDRGEVLNGNDTLGLASEMIAYHFTFFTIG
jgi:hypothetical protein